MTKNQILSAQADAIDAANIFTAHMTKTKATTEKYVDNIVNTIGHIIINIISMSAKVLMGIWRAGGKYWINRFNREVQPTVHVVETSLRNLVWRIAYGNLIVIGLSVR